MTGNDDPYEACSHSCSAPCDEMWKKFELFLTPPNSPPRNDSANDDDPAPDSVPLNADATVSTGNAVDGLDCMDFQPSPAADDFSDLSDIIYADLDICKCISARNLIKDCMWNGVGHKASSALRKAHNRTSSSQSPTPCHPNGCVDPRNIFPYPVGLTAPCDHKKMQPNASKSPQKYYKSTVDGAETHSDSEEEIDVVTVEKSQNTPTLKPKNATAPKIVATLVPKENGKLAIVASSGASLTTKGIVKTIARSGEAERGRAKNKFHVLTSTSSSSTTSTQQTLPCVAMAIDNRPTSNDYKSITTTNPALKRRHTTEELQNLMKMANPKLLMQRGGDSVSPVARFDKKRVLSLEGVSFCATAKARLNDPTMTRIPRVAEAQSNSTVGEIADSPLTASFKAAGSKTTITPIEIKEESEASGNCQNAASPPCKRKRKADAIVRLLPAGSGSDSEQIRAAHNVLERQRREGLRTSFLRLRDNVPELQRQEKAPKVHILNKARDYCQELQKTEKNLIAEKERLAKRNQRLLERLESAKISLHLIHRDSEVESENEESSSPRSEDSPLSSLPPSLPPSPQIFPAGEYYIARRVSQDNSSSPQEVVLRLEPTVNPKNRKRNTDYISALKQGSSQAGLRAFITPITKSQEATNLRRLITTPGGLSDGFEYLSEEEPTLP